MLMEMSVKNFIDLIASDAPAPGGGSVAALNGAIGAALITMVCRLSIGREDISQHEDELLFILEKAEEIRTELSNLIDRDTEAFNQVITAFQMPKTTASEKAERSSAIQDAFRMATEIPLNVAQYCCSLLELSVNLSNKYNSSTASDLGVSAQCAYAGTAGALLNVQINLPKIKDKIYISNIVGQILQIRNEADSLKKIIDDAIRHSVFTENL